MKDPRADVLAAESERRLAEAEKLRAEARRATLEAEVAALRLEAERRKHLEELAKNRYHRVYQFTQPVSDTSVAACIEQLTTWSRLEPGCDMEIVFDSPGGSVIHGLDLFDFIQELRRKGHRITTSARGMAASMAGILLQAGDHRVMGRECWVLIHEVSTLAMGKIGEIEDEVAFVKRIQERVLDIFASRCREAAQRGTASKPLTKAMIRRRWRRRDWWLSSDECLRFGLVDEVR
jgi:ATP-dependent protease ClpP protease subunit